MTFNTVAFRNEHRDGMHGCHFIFVNVLECARLIVWNSCDIKLKINMDCTFYNLDVTRFHHYSRISHLMKICLDHTKKFLAKYICFICFCGATSVKLNT